MSTVLAPQQQDHFVPQVNNDTYYYNQETKKHYFKVFLMNNKFNKRKFRVSNLQNLHKDVDGYENLPVTFVGDGIRKGNHPNPKDGNIFEANYQNKYTYVTKAIEYYKQFGIAKIVKIYKPDPNLLNASFSDADNILNYFALCETEHEKMIQMLESAKRENKKIYVSPAMFSWDWVKDPSNGYVNVNSFVPTHLAIVDSPAYDPEIAYIKKETCKKDGMSCYYDLFEAHELENLNNNSEQTSNMSTNKFPSTLEEYVKSYWSMEVVDNKNVNAEDLVKNMANYIIIDKSKVSQNNNTNPQPAQAIPLAKEDQAKPTNEPYKGEPAKAIPATTNKEEHKETTVTKEKETTKGSFTLEDVKALLQEQKQSILSEIKAQQTKGEREELLDTYLQNDKIKGVKDKVDQEKLKQTRELYNGLALDNAQLKTVLQHSIYNPTIANPDIYTSMLALSEENRKIDNIEVKNIIVPKPIGALSNPAIPKATTTATATKQVTEVPPKSIPNINGYGTEFKSSAEGNTNKYNDDYKGKGNGKNFSASKSDNEYRPVPTTGEGVPKRFQKYIQ